MRQPFEYRAVIGVLIWIGLIALGILLARKSFDRAPEATSLLAQYVGKQRCVVELEFPKFHAVGVGDPIYSSDKENVSPIGVVSCIASLDSTEKRPTYVTKAFATMYGVAPQMAEGDYFTYHSAPSSAAWVLQTMLPPAKREQLTRLIVDSYREHQNDIVAALKPIVKESLRDAGGVIRDDLKAAFKAREDQVQAISQRFQSDLLEKEIVPLVKEEIWPVIWEESAPLAGEVGQEIWSEVSVFRFGWRYLYDKTPLPEKKLAEKEFKRFVDNKAVPILESHVGEFVELQKKVVQRISKNENVKQAISKSIKTVIEDAEVQELLNDVFRDVFVNNDRLKVVLEEHWRGPAARQAIELAGDRLDPTITEIGRSLFGSPKEEITPEFARVLRRRILHKDRRWFTLHHTDSPNGNGAASIPSKFPVRAPETQSDIPYAPARDRN